MGPTQKFKACENVCRRLNLMDLLISSWVVMMLCGQGKSSTDIAMTCFLNMSMKEFLNIE